MGVQRRPEQLGLAGNEPHQAGGVGERDVGAAAAGHRLLDPEPQPVELAVGGAGAEGAIAMRASMDDILS
ncbi:hypothetical protein GCM10018952_19800 [Streptosporangium vulgare]